MVYSYGGDLTDGKSSSYDFEWLAWQTGHVIVSMNYRVNLFGFLALRELSQTSGTGVSGNLGFHDQVLALQWVQDNAASLGADPQRVTFFGQSSGGTSVFALLSSPRARGLFSRAISFSGSANLTMGLKEAEGQNKAIQAALGCAKGNAEEVVSCLQSKTVEEVQAAVPAAWNTVKALWSLPPASAAGSGMGYQGIAIVDGVLVTAPLQDALRAGTNPVPLIISSMAQETDAQPGKVVSGMSASAFADLITSAFQPWGVGAGGKVLQHYMNPASNMSSGQAQQLAYDSIMADYGQTCASIPTAIAAASRTGWMVDGTAGAARRTHPASPGRKNDGGGDEAAVYQLYISARPSHPVWGFDPTYQPRFAFHSLDILAGLGHWDLWSSSRGLPPFQPRQEDNDLRLAMVALLRNFSRDGRLSEDEGFVTVGQGCSAVGPDCYNVVDIRAGGVAASHRQFKASTCALWQSLGFGMRFWWSN